MLKHARKKPWPAVPNAFCGVRRVSCWRPQTQHPPRKPKVMPVVVSGMEPLAEDEAAFLWDELWKGMNREAGDQTLSTEMLTETGRDSGRIMPSSPPDRAPVRSARTSPSHSRQGIVRSAQTGVRTPISQRHRQDAICAQAEMAEQLASEYWDQRGHQGTPSRCSGPSSRTFSPWPATPMICHIDDPIETQKPLSMRGGFLQHCLSCGQGHYEDDRFCEGCGESRKRNTQIDSLFYAYTSSRSFLRILDLWMFFLQARKLQLQHCAENQMHFAGLANHIQTIFHEILKQAVAEGWQTSSLGLAQEAFELFIRKVAVLVGMTGAKFFAALAQEVRRGNAMSDIPSAVSFACRRTKLRDSDWPQTPITIKGGKRCARCQTSLSTNASFCRRCGITTQKRKTYSCSPDFDDAS